MDGKDSVPSQGIPAVVHALGAFALAAAMAVAIKWFILRDSKVTKTVDDEPDLQRNQNSLKNDPKVPDEVPGETTHVPQVSDGVEIDLTHLPYHCQLPGISRCALNTSCVSQVNDDVQEDRKELSLNIYGDFSPDKRESGMLTPVSCTLSTIAEPQCSLLKLGEAAENMPALTPDFMDLTTSDAQTHVSTSCCTHRCDVPYFESSERVQVMESSFETSSGNGECIEDMNVESLGCQQELIGHGNKVSEMFLKHRPVSLSLSGDTFNMDTYKKVGILNCDAKTNMVNYSKYLVENKYDVWSSTMGQNVQDNIIRSNYEREGHKIICTPRLSKLEENIITNTCMPIHSQFSDKHPKLMIKSSFDNAHGPADVKQTTPTLSTANEDVILTKERCKEFSQHETFHHKLDANIACSSQSDIRKEILFTDGKFKEVQEQLKASNKSSILGSMHAVEQHMTDKENIDTANIMFFLSTKVSLNSHNGKNKEETSPVDGQIESHSQNQSKRFHSSKCVALKSMVRSNTNNTFCHHDNSNVLKWSTTTVYNSTEYIDLMYPWDFHASGNSVNNFREKKQCQDYTEDSALLSKNKKMSEDFFEDLSLERTFKGLDADVESSVVSPTSCNTTYDEPKYITRTTNNSLRDPSTLDTFNSKTITKTDFVSSITSMNNTENKKLLHNLHKHEEEYQNTSTQECYSIIPNGCFSNSHKCPDANIVCNTSNMYKLGDNFGKDQRASITKTLSAFFQNTTLPIKEFPSWGHPYFCNDNNTPPPVMKETHIMEQKLCTEILNGESNIVTGSLSVAGVQKTFDMVDSLLLPTENAEQSNSLDETFLSSNITCFEKDQRNDFKSCNSIPSHKQEKYKSLPFDNMKPVCAVKADDFSISPKKMMSKIAENPELMLPNYQSVAKMKLALMTKSCDNINFGPSRQGPTLKNKAQSMLCLLTEYYSSQLHSLENGPVEEVARGTFICIPTGLQYIDESKRFQLTLGNCLQLLKLARKNSVPELLKSVYTVISDNYLNVLKNSAIYGHLSGLERERILQLRMRGHLSLCIVETKSIFDLNTNIKCSVATDQAQCKAQLYSLDLETNQWKRVTSIPEEACLKGCSICSMYNYLFIAGGIQKTKGSSVCSNKLFCYNPLTDIWTQLAPMIQARSQLKLIPLDGYLYAIGGECLHTMEKYDPRSNKWTFAAPLPKGSFAVAHEAAACGGEIYISGGHLFYRLLKYKPSRDQWEECPFNASKGRSCDMVAVGNILYRFDIYKNSTVNIFKYNTTTKVWSEYTTTFPGSKVPFRCAVLDDAIYCVNRETTARFSVENGKAVFESATFSGVPTHGVGYPCPVVLTLRGSISQTSV
ncbi:uncharacterized protein LOC135056529 [Pseudophryne corroboree]|uniref:uncharacterized protein LOC135056529 n=1 Tax=Pseudophryne corroboree TaxID=495146 RepID=UPI0030816715